MNRLRVGVIGVGLMIGAVACGGVDKDGTANNLVKSLESATGTTLDATQKSCVTTLVKSYSEDDLKKIDKALQQTDNTAPGDLETTFITKVAACVTPADSTAAPADSTTATT